MSKPREYWIVEELERYPKYPNDAYEEKPISGDFIHVIEYSAYVELLAKLEAAEKEIERLQALHLERTKTTAQWLTQAESELAKERAINAVLVEALGAISMAQPEGKQSIVPSIALEFTTNQAREALTKAKDMRDE